MSLAVPLSVPKARSTWLPFQIALFCVVWSLSFAVAKVALVDCPPLLLLMTRFLLAGLIMMGLAALKPGEISLTKRDLIAFGVIGIANNAMYLGFGYVGLRTVSAGLGTLVVSANPVLTAVLAAAFLGERLTLQKVAGLVLGVGGVGFIVAHRLSAGGGQDSATGLIFTFCALLSIVAGTILYKKLAPKGGMLVGNAVQAIGERAGRIAVAIEPVAEAAAASNATGKPRRFCRLTVSDDGPGIPDAIKIRLFDPFFTTGEVGTGVGLGLSIVYGIVNVLGGHIDVESTPGSGTRFAVFLPLADAEAAPLNAANDPEPSNPSPRTPAPRVERTLL